MEERLEEKQPEGLRIFLIVDRAVSPHHAANKKATSVPLEGSHETDDRARPGITAAGGLYLLPRIIVKEKTVLYLCFPEDVEFPSKV